MFVAFECKTIQPVSEIARFIDVLLQVSVTWILMAKRKLIQEVECVQFDADPDLDCLVFGGVQRANI